MSSEGLRQFSQELIDEIIDFLALHVEEPVWPYQKRRSHLSNCALVCRSFLPRSQMHLFSHITLPAMPGSRQLRVGDYSRISSLLTVLDQRPSLANHIQELCLILPGGHTSWMYYTPEMLELMERINSTRIPLRKLQISTSPTDISFKIPSITSHLNLIEYWKKAIAPYVTAICIENVTAVPPELIAMCTHLRDLTMLFTTVRQPTKCLNSEELWSTPPRIEQLEYNLIENSHDNVLTMFDSDTSVFDFSCLRHFTTYAHSSVENNILIQKIVNSSRSKGCLESLIYKMHPYSASSDFYKQNKIDSLI